MELTPREKQWAQIAAKTPELSQSFKPRLNKYIPWTPSVPQTVFLLTKQLEVLYGGAVAGGKLLHLESILNVPLSTHPSGFKLMGEIQVGDEVFAADGTPTRVVALSDIDYNPDAYEITFSDGAKVQCDARHLWWTQTEKERAGSYKRSEEYRARRRATRPSRGTGKRPDLAKRNATQDYDYKEPVLGQVRTTAEIRDTLRTRRGQANHSIPFNLPLELPEQNLPVPPYTYGAWLGDGSSGSSAFTQHIDDMPELMAQLEAESFDVSDIHASGKNFVAYGLITQLRKAGLESKESPIPVAYFRGSFEQRLAFLQGLMDTDGHCDKQGRMEFSNTRKHIAEAVVELVRGLGGHANVTEDVATLYGRIIGPKYRVKFIAPFPAFRLQRKLARQKLTGFRNLKRYIESVEPIDPIPMRCLKVAHPTGLFLVGREYIPTHNSVALLMAALQYCDLPNYSALLLRRTYKDLALPGALIDLSRQWLESTDAKYNSDDKVWRFPSGSTLTFGYLETESDRLRYQGSAYHFIGFDELTQFPNESLYTYLFSRLRGSKELKYPFRVRGATNPGGPGGKWVYERFFTNANPETRLFVPAKVTDNPFVDQEQYLLALNQLDPRERARLLEGRWDIMAMGEYFSVSSFLTIPNRPNIQYIRYWDLSAQTETTKDSDWTAGALVGVMRAGKVPIVVIADVVHTRGSPGYIEQVVRQTAEKDGASVRIIIEQEAGSGGVNTVFNYKKRVLPEFTVIGNRPQGPKTDRAGVLSGYAATGQVHMVMGDWNAGFVQEAATFPTKGIPDDRIDAVSSAAAYLLQKPEPKMRMISAAGPESSWRNPIKNPHNNWRGW